MRLHRTLAALVCLVALAACEKNAVQDFTGPVEGARIKFFNFGVNAPAVHFYTGAEKLTASSTGTCSNVPNPPVTRTDTLCLTEGVEAVTAIGYGSVSAGGLYTAIEPGQHTLSSKLMSVVDKGVAIASLPANIENGKAYSVYLSGFYNATAKTSDVFLVEDNFPAPIDWNIASVRFVNAIANSSPMTMYAQSTSTNVEAAVGGEVAYKAAGAFVGGSPGTYNLYTRDAGSTVNRITRANVAFEPGRTYTITSRGDMTVTSATATNRPFLDNTLNR
jgi:hypothetical protein